MQHPPRPLFAQPRFLPAIVAGLVLYAGGVHAAWDEKYYNPKPLPDDVLLPMPCDGAMTFRKVHIPLAGPLDDYAVTLGQDSEDWGYVEHARPEHIAGSFTTAAPQAARYYLIAKYELNALQYQAVVNDGQCPAPVNRLRLPQVSLSWFEALAFADRYNLWLRQHTAQALPREDGVAGFVRLPTEAEWEFAARGGLAVSGSEFRDVRFPMPEGGVNAYAWFGGSQSSNGKLQLTGLLHPNPLGLHDMLGNVDEMLFEPFRLNKLDRQHGQAGGFIVRGGNYLTSQAELRSALRLEQPYYRDAGEQRLKTTGVRLALVAPVLTSRARIQTVARAWQALGSGEAGAGELANSVQDIARGVEDEALKQQLEQLRNDMRASAAARDEQRNAAIRSDLELGAFLCGNLNDRGNYVDRLHAMYQRNCVNAGDDKHATCDTRKENLDKQEQDLAALLQYYSDSLVNSAGIYSREQIEPQVGVLEQEKLARRKQKNRENVEDNFSSFLQTHWRNLGTYLKNGRVAHSAWLDVCKSTS